MNPKSTAQILDAAAAERISSSLNLAPKILAKIHSEKRTIMRPGMKLASALLIVILAVLMITTIAYAIYRLTIGDPGLQSVQDAGLETHLNVTAQPTLLPTMSPVIKPQSPIRLGVSQSRSGVTLTLESIFLDESHLGLSMSFSNIPTGLDLGAPGITFAHVTPAQSRGWTERVSAAAGQAEFVSYQVIPASNLNGRVNLSVDVPLLQINSGKKTALDNFHFDLTNVPVAQAQVGMPLQQTYSVRVNGVEVRLESVRVTDHSTDVLVCYDAVVSGVQSASVQLDGGQKAAFKLSAPQDAVSGNPCVLLTFPGGSAADEKQLILHIDELSSTQKPGEKLTGSWDFYVDLPDHSASPVQATTAPVSTIAALGAQTMQNVTVTLDWVFVDARRAAIGYTVRGLPDSPTALGLYGHILLKNAQGEMMGGAGIGSSSIERVEGQPGVLQGTWSVGFEKPFIHPESTFTLDITLDGTQTNDFLGVFPFAPEATPYPPGVFPPLLPNRLIGTYHFEFTVPVHPMQTIDPLPPINANGVVMRIPRIEMTASLTEVMVCFNKPSAEDWWVMSAELKDGNGSTASIHGGSLLFDNETRVQSANSDRSRDWPIPQEINTSKNGRCLTLNFLLGHGNRSGPITLIIHQIQISIPEYIPDDQIRNAREKLKAQGILLDYTTSSSGGGGGGGPTFSSLPKGVSQEKAYELFLEALGYVHSGPWVFTIDVKP